MLQAGRKQLDGSSLTLPSTTAGSRSNLFDRLAFALYEAALLTCWQCPATRASQTIDLVLRVALVEDLEGRHECAPVGEP